MIDPKQNNEKRVKRIRRLLKFKSDTELADYLETKQPQISRWRNTGFHQTTANLIDTLLSIISELQKQLADAKRENKHLKKELQDNFPSVPPKLVNSYEHLKDKGAVGKKD